MAVSLKTEPAYHIPLNDNNRALIGTICAIWAQIDRGVDYLIMGLARIPDQQTLRLLTDRKEISSKVELLKSLTKKSSPILKSEISAICASVKHWGQKRNEAVHGHWTGIKDEYATAILYSRLRFIKSSQLQEIAENLSIISRHVFHVHWKHFCEPQNGDKTPWSDILPPLVPSTDQNKH